MFLASQTIINVKQIAQCYLIYLTFARMKTQCYSASFDLLCLYDFNKIANLNALTLFSCRYCVQINNVLKYIAFVVTIIFKYTQNLLRVKTTMLLKFIKIYNKRKIIFVNNINILFANIVRNF